MHGSLVPCCHRPPSAARVVAVAAPTGTRAPPVRAGRTGVPPPSLPPGGGRRRPPPSRLRGPCVGRPRHARRGAPPPAGHAAAGAGGGGRGSGRRGSRRAGPTRRRRGGGRRWRHSTGAARLVRGSCGAAAAPPRVRWRGRRRGGRRRRSVAGRGVALCAGGRGGRGAGGGSGCSWRVVPRRVAGRAASGHWGGGGASLGGSTRRVPSACLVGAPAADAVAATVSNARQCLYAERAEPQSCKNIDFEQERRSFPMPEPYGLEKRLRPGAEQCVPTSTKSRRSTHVPPPPSHHPHPRPTSDAHRRAVRQRHCHAKVLPIRQLLLLEDANRHLLPELDRLNVVGVIVHARPVAADGDVGGELV